MQSKLVRFGVGTNLAVGFAWQRTGWLHDWLGAPGGDLEVPFQADCQSWLLVTLLVDTQEKAPLQIHDNPKHKIGLDTGVSQTVTTLLNCSASPTKPLYSFGDCPFFCVMLPEPDTRYQSHVGRSIAKFDRKTP